MSERAQKLAIFAAAVAFTVVYHWLAFGASGHDVYRLWLMVAAAVSGFFLLVTWLVPLAQGKIAATFFDRAAGWLLLADVAVWIGYALLWGRTPRRWSGRCSWSCRCRSGCRSCSACCSGASASSFGPSSMSRGRSGLCMCGSSGASR